MLFKSGTTLGFIAFSYVVLGNLHIPQPHVMCKEICPVGKYCISGDTWCRTPVYRSKLTSASYPRIRRQALSTDGRCGPNNGGTICDPNSTVYKGSCCSAAGWCGNTVDHCGTGCVSGCTSTTPPPQTSTGTPTTDGTCGRDNGGKTCVGWSTGECCSMYGWCGNTDSHCGAGCQSGPCTGGSIPSSLNSSPAPNPANPTPGSFAIVGRSGVPAMHAGLLPNGRVVFLDKVEDFTELKLPNGQFAYSSEYDPNTNTVVPLAYKTNAFCSGGIFLQNGDFVSLGGNGPLIWVDPTVTDGFDAIRYLTRSSSNAALNGQAWKEPGNKLASPRWYASAQILADGRVFVASGSLNGLDPSHPANNNPTYEILSPTGISSGKNVNLDILVQNQPYYMYPFMHLLRNGFIFIFVAKSSQIFNIETNMVVKSMPELPGLYRTYPNTGGSVLLPLTYANGWASKIMICGGGSYQDITSPTDASCGLISPEDKTPTWEMESMPEGRVMVEGVLLPDGTVLWLNGANQGAQGFLLADKPTMTALLYNPAKAAGQRWSKLATSTIPRLYHSVALLLLDGTVLVAGSNPNEMPVQTVTPKAPYITEFRVERYTPPYLSGTNANRRPTNVVISVRTLQADELFQVKFNAPTGAKDVEIVLYYGGFVTHNLHMGHRMMVLERQGFKPNQTAQVVTSRTPPNKNICPPGPYVIYVVVDGVPSIGQFVMIA